MVLSGLAGELDRVGGHERRWQGRPAGDLEFSGLGARFRHRRLVIAFLWGRTSCCRRPRRGRERRSAGDLAHWCLGATIFGWQLANAFFSRQLDRCGKTPIDCANAQVGGHLLVAARVAVVRWSLGAHVNPAILRPIGGWRLIKNSLLRFISSGRLRVSQRVWPDTSIPRWRNI